MVSLLHSTTLKLLTATTREITMAGAWALLSPPLNSPSYYSPISTRPINPKPNSHIFFANRNQSSKGRRRTVLITNATANQNDKDKDQDSDSPGFNPFGFVTDNPSSRSAIQLPESPAEAGNVGQMLNVSSALFCA